MALVFAARDLRHDRPVAIKVLRPELAPILGTDRFLREIKLTATLQHPHILSFFDSGEADGLVFYVMPYVEGDSLRHRLNREKQLPVDEAVRIGIEVASALDYAHRQGVIHRDIKPENILLQDGTVLVADFGIALAATRAGGSRLTDTGLALGTPAYMSPEQATGERELDARSDVYSLGCVLYEILAGEVPFTGHSAQVITSRRLKESPRPVTDTRPTVPAPVAAAVHKALERLPADRFATAGQFAAALTRLEVVSTPPGVPALVGSLGTTWRRALVLGMVLGGVVVAAGANLLTRRTSPEDGPVVRLTMSLPPGQRLHRVHSQPALSSDSRLLAYIAIENDTSRLYIRPLDRFETRRVPGSEGADFAFFSPDGAWIGFFVGQNLFKAPVGGGGAIQLGSFPRTGRQWAFDGGATWGLDRRIYIGQKSRGLWAISEEGGPPTQVTSGDTNSVGGDTWPKALGDNRVLFARYDTVGRGFPAILDPADGHVTVVDLEGAFGSSWYLDSGHLIYRAAELLAVRFDPNRGARRDPAVRVLEDANPSTLSVSRTGVAYAAYPSGSSRQLVWVDREGRSSLAYRPRAWIRSPRLSPDGTRVAVEGAVGVSIVNLTTGAQILLPQSSVGAAWTPDGKRVAYVCDAKACPPSSIGGEADLYWRKADGSGDAEVLFRGPLTEVTASFSPDGQLVALTERGANNPGDLAIVDRSGNRLGGVTGPGSQWNARISPDGRWLAYQSNESGRWDIYVQRFPTLDDKHSVSPEGGTEPVWSRNGRELFFRNGDQMTSTAVRLGPTFVADRPQVLFKGLYRYPENEFQGWSYDVAPDGRFLMVEEGGEPEIRVVLNFGAELKRLAPRSQP